MKLVWMLLVSVAILLAIWVAAAFGGQGSEVGRPYARVLIEDVPKTSHTHICTVGIAVAIHKEADGDVHIRVEDPARPGVFIIAEIIPTLIPKDPAVIHLPKKGMRIEICGITRYDNKHLWWEIHPVERLR